MNIAAFLTRFTEIGHRVLQGKSEDGTSQDMEVEIDYGELFEFMLNPGADTLRRLA